MSRASCQARRPRRAPARGPAAAARRRSREMRRDGRDRPDEGSGCRRRMRGATASGGAPGRCVRFMILRRGFGDRTTADLPARRSGRNRRRVFAAVLFGEEHKRHSRNRGPRYGLPNRFANFAPDIRRVKARPSAAGRRCAEFPRECTRPVLRRSRLDNVVSLRIACCAGKHERHVLDDRAGSGRSRSTTKAKNVKTPVRAPRTHSEHGGAAAAPPRASAVAPSAGALSSSDTVAPHHDSRPLG